jgi:oligopeptidase B
MSEGSRQKIFLRPRKFAWPFLFLLLCCELSWSLLTPWKRSFPSNRGQFTATSFNMEVSSSETSGHAHGINNATTLDILSPPMPRREEDRVAYAGVAPPGWNASIPRGEDNATLMDPPIPIPDPYGWIQRGGSTTNQEEIDELIAQENAYTEQQTAHLTGRRQELIKEWKQYDSVEANMWVKLPVCKGSYWYYTRQDPSSGYSITARCPTGITSKKNEDTSDIMEYVRSSIKDSSARKEEEILLDENLLASSGYFSVHSIEVSPDHQQVVYSIDTTGNETFQLYHKSLTLHDDTDSRIDNEQPRILVSAMCGSVVWHKDSARIYMLQADATGRPYQVIEYSLNDDSMRVVWEEHKPLFWCRLHQSFDEEYLMVGCTGPTDTTTYHVLPLSTQEASSESLNLMSYPDMNSLEHGNDYWYMIVGQNSIFRLNVCLAGDLKDVVEVRDLHNHSLFSKEDSTLSLNTLKVFPKFLVVQGRQGGIPRIWVVSFNDDNRLALAASVKMLSWEEQAHYVRLEETAITFASSSIVVSYQSLVTPPQYWLIDLMDPSRRKLLYQQVVPGYDRNDYGCERLWISSRDGQVEIPVSLVYRRDTLNSSIPAPLHLFGYGAYGHSLESAFSSLRIPLLDRGFIWATAHVRGGGELGNEWHKMGIKGDKIQSIHDFVDVANALIANGYTNSSLMSCEGRSAGGLLAASAINQAPNLFRTALLGVPFLDVLTSMTDSSIPLTTVEWKEWGNPNQEHHYEAIKNYCPLQTIPKDMALYPSCFLVGGLNDQRVPFSDPLKFAAAVRYSRNGIDEIETSRPVCVRIDTAAGHSFGSNKEKYFTELSLFYAFLLGQIGTS